MNLPIINRLKKQFNNNEILKNYLSVIILLTYCYFWISIGKYVEINFNEFLNNESIYLINGLIYLIIFSACLSILIIKLIINRKLPILSILIIYPVASSIGYFQNINFHQNFNFLIHFFFTISTLFIFFSILEDHKDKKKLFKYFFKISSIFISLVFIIMVFPDLVSRIKNDIHVRDTHFVTLNLFFIDYIYTQNSNGASRIAILLFIFFFTKLIFKIKKNKKYKKYLFLNILLSIIIFYYQSRLAIIFIVIYVLLWILTFSNKSFFLKIIFFVSIIFIPFIFQNIYNTHLDKKIQIPKELKKQKEMKIAWDNWDKGFTKADGTIVAPKTGTAPRPPMLVNNPGEARKYFEQKKKQNLSIFKNNRFLGTNFKFTGDKFHAAGSSVKCRVAINYKIFEIADIYSSGRICGWEILLRDIDKKDIIFGKGFFYDQKFLNKYEKISSNSYMNIIYNSGLFGFFPFLFIFIIVMSKYHVIYNLYKKSDYDDFLLFNLILFLLIRSFFEDTFAFVSIDLILFLTCSGILSSKIKEFQNNKKLK